MQHKEITINLSAFDESPEMKAKRQVFWSRVRRYGTYYLVPLIILIYAIRLSETILLIWFVWLMLAPIGLGVLFLSYPSDKDELDKSLIRFGADNDLAYLPDVNYQSEGVIFKVGNKDHFTSPMFHGKLHSYEFAMYWHRFTTGSGNNNTPRNYAVFEIEVPKRLPHIFLDCKHNDILQREVLGIFNDNERIVLEGDFNNYFNVYGLRRYAAEILTLLNPAFMDSLVKNDTSYELEFKDNTVYVYLPDQFAPTAEGIIDLYTAGEFMILELQKQLDTYRYEPAAADAGEIDASILKRLASWL